MIKRLLVFTYAPAGLGHLRVTDAIMAGVPTDNNVVILGSDDQLITLIHAFTSNNKIARRIFEFSQYGLAEDIFTMLYVSWLKLSSLDIYKKLLDLIDLNPGVSEILVVATHFGMAHQVGVVKDRVFRKKGVRINLVVVVTDDTSQHMWVVKGADLTLVPSRLTKKLLVGYAKNHNITMNCEVSPYPVSQKLTKELNIKKGLRESALVVNSVENINIMIPISGAAVGLEYLQNLVTGLSGVSTRFQFFVVAKRSSKTIEFLKRMAVFNNVNLFVGESDHEVVNLYEEVYEKNLIHLEITKPSEQAFKALLRPSMVGGAILLLIQPVGRQEYDNLDFLKRHALLSDDTYSLAESDDENIKSLRAIALPNNSVEAVKLISYYLENELFMKMVGDKFEFKVNSFLTSEVDSRGVWLFWERLRLSKLID